LNPFYQLKYLGGGTLLIIVILIILFICLCVVWKRTTTQRIITAHQHAVNVIMLQNLQSKRKRGNVAGSKHKLAKKETIKGISAPLPVLCKHETERI
jgi:hypothetical protein